MFDASFNDAQLLTLTTGQAYVALSCSMHLTQQLQLNHLPGSTVSCKACRCVGLVELVKLCVLMQGMLAIIIG